MYSGKIVVFGQKWLFSCISGCIWAKRLYSGKSGCIRESGCTRANDVLFRQSGYILTKLLFSGKVLLSAKSGCIPTKKVVFGQSGCIRAEVIVFRQKW